MFSTRGGPSGMEKQRPSGIPASRYLHQHPMRAGTLGADCQSRLVFFFKKNQINLKKQFTCIVNVAAVQHGPHEVEAMHSDSRASAELSSSKKNSFRIRHIYIYIIEYETIR